MSRFRRILAAVVATSLLTSCGGGTGSDAPGALPTSRTETGKPSTSTSPSPVAPKTQLSVPSLYDTSRGWESDLPGTQLRLPHSGAVAVANGPTISVLDVSTGQQLWKAEVDGYGMTSTFSVTVAGKDYLVVSSSGVKGEDVVSKGREVTMIDIFPGRATGEDVKPAHHLELDGNGHVRAAGSGLLVTMDDEDDVVMTLDPATGTTKTYDLSKLEPPDSTCGFCGKTEVVAVTPVGPLLTKERRRLEHYWVPGKWSGGDLPRGEGSIFIIRVQDALLASWHEKGVAHEVWAVLDPATAKVRAKVTCEPQRQESADAGKGATISANGRYLVRNHTAFDLETGTGHCFEETETDKPVQLRGVTDDGIAFGIGAPSATVADPRVIVDLTTGQVEAGDYIEIPFADYSGYGLFWDASEDTMVAYPHAE